MNRNHESALARFALALLAGCLCGLDANAQTLLRWTLKPGTVYDVERTIAQKQIVEIQGKATTEERKSIWRVRLQATEQRGDEFIVLATLAEVRHHLVGVVKEELLDANLHEKIQGANFTMRVAPDGRIVEFGGYEDFLMRVAGGRKGATKVVRQAYPEVMLRDAFGDIFVQLPDKAVKPGDSWQRAFVEPIPHFGTFQAKAIYTYESDKDNTARIATTITTKYELPKNESAVVFRVVQGTIETEKSEGMLTFNRQAGHVAQHDRRWLLQGKLVIEAANQRQTVVFTSESMTSILIAVVKK